MKKVVLLSVFSVLLLTSKSEAQGFQFVTSFGVEQHWNLPYDVYYTLDHYYLGYNWVHARRVYDQGGLYFEVVLQRGDVFVRVSLDRRGRIFQRVVTYDYPFHNHICNDYCGYHTNYYVSHRSYCGSSHHHGHNHVVYRPVVVNKHYHHPNGNAYGHYKNGHKHGHDKYNKGNRIDYDPRYRSRRSGSVRVASNYEKSRINVDRGGRDNHDNDGPGYGRGDDRGGKDDHGYDRGNNDKGNNGKGYGRGGNRGNNGNAYGRGKDTGKGSSGLGRGRGDGNKYTQDERSKRRDNNSSGRSRPTYRSRSRSDR